MSNLKTRSKTLGSHMYVSCKIVVYNVRLKGSWNTKEVVRTTNIFIPHVKKLCNIASITLEFSLILPCKVLHKLCGKQI